MFNDKVILVTGGTGSFGNAVVNRFLNTGVREIRILSRDEKKQDDMRNLYNSPKLKFYIGDVRNYDSIFESTKGVDFIFHAAALKQVPSCEFFPLEAVRTNILGAENVMNAAVANRVQRVIFLSTDKAVYPINAMGMSKALMEKTVVARSRNLVKGETVLCCTRYGNVMASRGSVIPLFVEQIKAKRPITATDPSMTRFMMSLTDAVNLVLYAYEHGEQGDLFVQKAPAATMGDLAVVMKEIFNSKVEVRVIGTRHGEKLYETLVTREEMAKATDLGDYYRIRADNRDLNYGKYFSEGEQKVAEHEDYNSHNTHRLSRDELKTLLLGLDYIKEELAK
ncbi:MAG TPA: polysaccharide biosynthesis protein [bacterium]|nr:polysaccharide biosynthesis protein [bacterium]